MKSENSNNCVYSIYDREKFTNENNELKRNVKLEYRRLKGLIRAAISKLNNIYCINSIKLKLATILKEDGYLVETDVKFLNKNGSKQITIEMIVGGLYSITFIDDDRDEKGILLDDINKFKKQKEEYFRNCGIVEHFIVSISNDGYVQMEQITDHKCCL